MTKEQRGSNIYSGILRCELMTRVKFVRTYEKLTMFEEINDRESGEILNGIVLRRM